MEIKALIKNNKCSLKSGIAISLLMSQFSVYAAEPQSCQSVTFSDPGWSDIGATNGVVTTLLEGLGYKTQVYMLSVPIGFESLKTGKVDVFMGNWLPAQKTFIEKYQGDIDVVRTNLDGVKFTLAVPEYVYQAGVHSFTDLNKFADQFDDKIYGIAPGSPANENLKNMINADDYNLGKWQVVESSEQGMLSQVSRAIKRNKYIAFLAWEPHPMNVNFDIRYLSGGDKYFGPNYGSAQIQTLTKKGFGDTCKNVGTLLNNLAFNVDMENEIINQAKENNISAKESAQKWITAHPQVLDAWLNNVTTFSGDKALPAIQQQLKIGS
ncbi:choline ABC transporter substrate-binding protein [Vibrio viridaestus]|uniref:Choline ABC transporter substrate-binding protein n=1 Tax=Vibrio viridaestus TaxID=2487322 RepID=A0A3N9TFW7_9VIBR|nr:choline ABC transporter substrate-binding protein [Vibrio viridaestus]RQW62643.1 choline ABC transporter substrate-binding protein [Vibrio viridaestus]